MRALHEDLTPAWERANTSAPALADHILVCEDSSKPYNRAGIVGLNPKTSKLLWARRGKSVAEDRVLGTWGLDVVINHTARTSRGEIQAELAGLNPNNGQTRWTLPCYFVHYAFHEEWMILAPYLTDKEHPVRKIVAYRKKG